MKESFKNLTRRNNDKLAIGLLTLLSILMIVANRFVYPLLETPESKFEIFISTSLIGMVLAEMALLSIWTVLSSQRLFLRLQLLLVATVVLFSAWLLGYVGTFSTEIGLNLRNREPLYYLGWIPLTFLAMCTPLIVLRFFGSRVLAPRDAIAPTRQPVTITSLMIATGLIAFVAASLQLPALIGDRPIDIWSVSGAIAGIFFLIGMLFVLPVTLILFSTKRRFFVWSPGILIVSPMLTVGFVVLLLYFTRARLILRNEDWQVPIQLAATAMFFILFGIGVIRLFGYRLVKSIKDRSATL